MLQRWEKLFPDKGYYLAAMSLFEDSVLNKVVSAEGRADVEGGLYEGITGSTSSP
jgi:hypothetical protein